MLTTSSLRAALHASTDLQIPDVEVFEEIDSTNAEALRRLKSGGSGISLVVARSQTAGRGRRGRQWLSPLDAGIYLSLSQTFSQQTSGLQAMSLVTALSVVEALCAVGAANLQLKWPNDILVDNHKLSGILLEMHSAGDMLGLVFGIGINLDLPEELRANLDRPVTDLRSCTRNRVDVTELIIRICRQLLGNLSTFERAGFASFVPAWNALDRYIGRDIVITDGQHEKTGQSAGVDADGCLLLRTASGLERIGGGEIFPSLQALEDGES